MTATEEDTRHTAMRAERVQLIMSLQGRIEVLAGELAVVSERLKSAQNLIAQLETEISAAKTVPS